MVLSIEDSRPPRSPSKSHLSHLFGHEDKGHTYIDTAKVEDDI